MECVDRHSMQRVIMHRSYGKLVLSYADGHRAVFYDREQIQWYLSECDALVSFMFYYLLVFKL